MLLFRFTFLLIKRPEAKNKKDPGFTGVLVVSYFSYAGIIQIRFESIFSGFFQDHLSEETFLLNNYK